MHLFTGVPGTGKTAAAVDLVRQLVDGGKRPLFVIEIPEENVEPLDLKLKHTLLGPGDAQRWHQIVPDGAVVFMPEAQRLWPARPPSSKVPDHVEALGQHRHREIDVVIDTQSPKLIDEKARARVRRHVHVRDLGAQGRHWYEWPEAANPAQWKSAPVKKKYKLPKDVFDLYTSATGHTKMVRSFPPAMIVLAVCSVLVLLLASRFVYRWLWGEAAYAPPAHAAAAAASAASSPAAGISAAPAWMVGRGATTQAPQWPIYKASPVKPDAEPYDLRALQIEGLYSIGSVQHVVFGLLVQGQRVASVRLQDLLRAGYVWTLLAPCAGVLRWGEVERMVTCPSPARQAPPGPMPAASGPQNAPA